MNINNNIMVNIDKDTYKSRNIGKSTRKYKPIVYRDVSP